MAEGVQAGGPAWEGIAARMGPYAAERPVEAPLPSAPPLATAPAQPTRDWPEGALEQAEGLQRLLTIGDRDWHRLKGQRSRRAAEQLAAALVQLLAGDEPARVAGGAARERAIALTEHALGWLRADISAPACPDHGR